MDFLQKSDVRAAVALWISVCLQFAGSVEGVAGEPDGPDVLARPALVQRIRSGIELLDRRYWSPTLGIWLDRPGDDLRAHWEGRLNPPWWPSANAVEMLLDFMARTGSPEYEAQIATLYDLNRQRQTTVPRVVAELKRRKQWSDGDEQKWRIAQTNAEARARGDTPADAPVGGAVYYLEFRNEYLDDSGWWGVAWLEMYDRTHDPKYLATARTIHAHLAKNWRPEKNGGVMWSEDADKQVPNAITNSLFLLLSARLSQRTDDPQYLKWAGQTLDWLHAKALFDGTGVVDAPGHHGDYWTYNQGLYLGALSSLFEATGREEHLEEAVKVAEGVLHRSGLTRPDGVFVEKLGAKGGDAGLFKGIMVHYLARLRDLLDARKIHPETGRRIDECIRASAVSILGQNLSPDAEFPAEWNPGGKDRTANFNSQVSALLALVSVLPEPPK